SASHPLPQFQATLKSAMSLFPSDQYVRCLLTLFFHSFYSVATSTLHYVQCVSVAGQLVVQSSPSIDCRSPQYHQWLPLVVVVLVVDVCILPVVIFVFLYRHRREING